MTTFEQSLQSIRQKPERVRKHIAFWSSFGITLVIVVFWLAAGPFYQRSAPSVASRAESPWNAMAASAGDAWSSIKSAFGASTATYTAPPLEVSPGK